MKNIISLLLIVFFALPVFAKRIDVETAKFAAKNLYYIKVNQVKDVMLSEIHLTLAHTELSNSEIVYYVFNVNEKEGFVIISADDIARPCIGYSFEGGFPGSNHSPEFNYWMNGFSRQISDAVSKKITASSEAIGEWKELLSSSPEIQKSKSIMPLLLTNWNQGNPYNELCPEDEAGPGGHVYVGCVATAMVQVMKYYNYPRVGTGTHTHYSDYGNLTVNFAAQNYIWEEMPNNSSTYEVAKISYHCSVALNMGYSAGGSGAQVYDIPDALSSHFKYSTDGDYTERDNYSDNDWQDLIKNQIDNNWPIVYCGFDDNGGHAWNCDGYNATEFHMNWGWGGSYNGYFTLDNLVAGGYDFSYWHAIAYNLYPAANYPEGCTSATKTITGEAGTFNDGSGIQDYPNNKDCTYLIQRNCASTIDLIFDRFDLASGDAVYVYDGTSASDPLIGTYTSVNLPPATVTAVNGAMFIRFVTDGTGTAEGWDASYSVFPCRSTRTMTNLSGTITDGSSTCDYNNLLNCRWDISPAGTNPSTIFHLSFPDFNFAPGDAGDYIKIYKNTLSTSNVVGTYNIDNMPPDPLNIVATKVIVKFISNSTGTSSGWTLNYTTTITGVDNNLIEYSANVFPNPFINDATISYSLPEATDVSITLTNVLGETIGTYKSLDQEGTHSIPLLSFVEKITQGIYFVKLSFNDKSTVIKIICTK